MGKKKRKKKEEDVAAILLVSLLISCRKNRKEKRKKRGGKKRVRKEEGEKKRRTLNSFPSQTRRPRVGGGKGGAACSIRVRVICPARGKKRRRRGGKRRSLIYTLIHSIVEIKEGEGKGKKVGRSNLLASSFQLRKEEGKGGKREDLVGCGREGGDYGRGGGVVGGGTRGSRK